MSTLNTNTIQGVNDPNKVTLPTTVTVGATILTDGSAGSTTITAEGGTNATNLQSGLLKAWDFYDGGAFVVYESFREFFKVVACFSVAHLSNLCSEDAKSY